MNVFFKPAYSLLFIALVFLCCSGSGEKIAGGASDHGNAVAGIIQSDTTLVPESTRVVVYEYDAVPLFGGTDTTHAVDSTYADSVGYYIIRDLNHGVYNLEFRNREYSALVSGIAVDSSKDTLVELDAFLKESAMVTGSVVDDSSMPAEDIFCYIRGTSVIAKSDDHGMFHLRGVPEGEYTIELRSHMENPAVNTDIRADTLYGTIQDVRVAPGSSMNLDQTDLSSVSLQDSNN